MSGFIIALMLFCFIYVFLIKGGEQWNKHNRRKKIDSLNRFSEFYKNLGNRDMYNYYLKRIDNLEIRLNYLKKIKRFTLVYFDG